MCDTWPNGIAAQDAIKTGQERRGRLRLELAEAVRKFARGEISFAEVNKASGELQRETKELRAEVKRLRVNLAKGSGHPDQDGQSVVDSPVDC